MTAITGWTGTKLPFVLIPVGALTGILTGNRTLLLILGPRLIAYGIDIS